jgi:hypothetical protein
MGLHGLLQGYLYLTLQYFIFNLIEAKALQTIVAENISCG